jgi:hypothetical protein
MSEMTWVLIWRCLLEKLEGAIIVGLVAVGTHITKVSGRCLSPLFLFI